MNKSGLCLHKEKSTRPSGIHVFHPTFAFTLNNYSNEQSGHIIRLSLKVSVTFTANLLYYFSSELLKRLNVKKGCSCGEKIKLKSNSSFIFLWSKKVNQNTILVWY